MNDCYIVHEIGTKNRFVINPSNIKTDASRYKGVVDKQVKTDLATLDNYADIHAGYMGAPCRWGMNDKGEVVRTVWSMLVMGNSVPPSTDQEKLLTALVAVRQEKGKYCDALAKVREMSKELTDAKAAMKAGFRSIEAHKKAKAKVAAQKLAEAKKAEEKAVKERLAKAKQLVKANVGRYAYISRGWAGTAKHLRKVADTVGFSSTKTNHNYCELITKDNINLIVKRIA